MGDTSDKEVGFGGTERKRLAFNAAKRLFDKVDRAFDESAVAVEIVPMLGVAGNTGVKAEVLVRVSVDAAAVRRVGARIRTGTRVGFSGRFGMMTDEFKAYRAVFTAANTVKEKRGIVDGTKGSAVDVEKVMSSRGIARVERDTDTAEMKIITEHGVGIIFIKRRITEESMVRTPEMRVRSEKVEQNGFERGRIGDFFINSRVISFLRNDFGVSAFETFVKKRDMPYDTETIRDNAEFMSVAEMPVDILLINKRVSLRNVGQL